MSMNKQSNTYTLIYIIVLVLLVGAALALTSISLRDRQQANADADKMRQILACVNITAQGDSIKDLYQQYVTASFTIDANGENVDADAFTVNVAQQSKSEAETRQLPVYQCTLADGTTKYVLPMYGAGLWGPIWGYVSIDSDGSTIYGAYFAHQGETPGLGAEIEKPDFSNQFKGKHLLINDTFTPVAVIKSGMNAPEGRDHVDGISGGTITSKGVDAMIDNCLAPYASFLKGLANSNISNH